MRTHQKEFVVNRPYSSSNCIRSAFLAVLCVAGWAIVPAQQTITYNGHAYWLNGINIPWNHFGTDAGGADYYSPADPINGYDSAWFETCFTQCQAGGINCARLWIHTDGRATPEFDTAKSLVTGLDATFLSDFGKILAAAKRHKVMLMPCLWSFDMDKYRWCREMIDDSVKTLSYINNALVPMVEAFANADNLIAWEVINEPEWMVYPNPKVTVRGMIRFTAMIAAAIHAHSSKMVTQGAAWMAFNSDKSPAFGNYWSDSSMALTCSTPGAKLDFYQVHWYEASIDITNPAQFSPFSLTRPVSYWGLDKPVIVGECAALVSGTYTMPQKLNNAYSNGYAGVMFWSYNSNWKENWTTIKTSCKAFRDAHPGIVDYTASTFAQNRPSRSTGSSSYTFRGTGNDLHISFDSPGPHQATVYNLSGAVVTLRTDFTEVWRMPIRSGGIYMVRIDGGQQAGTASLLRAVSY